MTDYVQYDPDSPDGYKEVTSTVPTSPEVLQATPVTDYVQYDPDSPDGYKEVTSIDLDSGTPSPQPSAYAWGDTDGPMNQEAIMANPKAMKLIREAMAVRFGVDNRNKILLDPSYDSTEDDKKVFEQWQNWNRSFSGGQTVTTASEVAFHQSASEESKALIGSSYELFDQMPNIFSKDTGWGDTFDGVRDYMRAAIVDPTTVAGIGVGRVAAGVGTKAAAVAIRTAAKGAATKSAAKATVQVAVKERAKKMVRDGAVLAAIDLPSAVGADLGYQYSMIQGGAQDEYSGAQSAMSALGALALPAIGVSLHGIKSFAGTKFAENIHMQNYVRATDALDGQTSAQAIQDVVIAQMDTDKFSKNMGVLFEDFSANMKKYEPWTTGKAKGEAVVNAKAKGEVSIGDMDNLFWSSMLFGRPDGKGPKGLVKSLEEVGFVYIPRGPDDTISNFMGDVIANLPKKQADLLNSSLKASVKPYVDKFNQDTFKDFTARELGLYLKKRSSNAGRTLGEFSLIKKHLKGPSLDGLGKELGEELTEENLPRRIQYFQSVYKRLLTSHPGTTGMNIKGYAVQSAANTVSDAVEAALHGVSGIGKGLRGKEAESLESFTKASGSILGAMRRGYNVFNYMDTTEAAVDFMSLKPKIAERMHRHISGGVDSGNTVKDFGMDPTNKGTQTVESFANTMQTWTGVKIQDEITKQIAFMSSLDQEIMKKYGKSYNEFMAQPDAFRQMFTPEFKQIEELALERTLRETFSKSYTKDSAKSASSLFRPAAEFIETMSNTPGIGMLIPFGQFLNNATASLGDYTGVNFARHFIHKRIGGQIVNPVESDELQLLAKGIVGLTAVRMYYGPEGEKKIKEGLRWNQVRRSDGSIADKTYEAPESFALVLGQLLAHHNKDGQVPKELLKEATMLVVGQNVREFSDFGKTMGQMLTAMTEGDVDEIVGIMAGGVGRVGSGMTRFADPVNQLAAMSTDSYNDLDRRQGLESWNNGIRYIDELFPISTAPEERNRPLNTNRKPQDMGKVLGGNRESQAPSNVEKMLASTGKSPWNAVKWDGKNPELKNRMDSLIQPIINKYADEALEAFPDFFDLPLTSATGESRTRVLQEYVIEPAKIEAREMFDASNSVKDEGLSRLKSLQAFSKQKIKDAMSVVVEKGDLEYGVPPEELVLRPGGIAVMDIVLDILQNPDEWTGVTGR